MMSEQTLLVFILDPRTGLQLFTDYNSFISLVPTLIDILDSIYLYLPLTLEQITSKNGLPVEVFLGTIINTLSKNDMN